MSPMRREWCDICGQVVDVIPGEVWPDAHLARAHRDLLVGQAAALSEAVRPLAVALLNAIDRPLRRWPWLYWKLGG